LLTRKEKILEAIGGTGWGAYLDVKKEGKKAQAGKFHGSDIFKTDLGISVLKRRRESARP
jgi:hypothetical protein